MNRGFTLAEVLITLAIIGIVAALTIPSVISNYQQQEFKTGLKKAVSVLNEAIQTNIATDGETPYENQDLFKYLQRHMSVLKTGYIHYDSPEGRNYGNYTFYTTDGMRFELYNGELELKLHESAVNPKNNKTIVVGQAQTYTPGIGVHNIDITETKNGLCGSYGLTNNPNKTMRDIS